MLTPRHRGRALLASAAMNPTCNLILVGPTGAGKTCVGRRLAAHFGLPFIDADRE
ncbi:MAG TPA: shikimate kinase, partial [Lysobacter sp.]